MKKLMMILALALMAFGRPAFADDLIAIPSDITIKQGFVIPWEDSSSGLMNMSTVTIARTEAFENGKWWNAIWEGWSLDAAWSYDAGTSNFGLMVGRHFGTLGKYLPISYPLADKIDITLYPIGVIVDDPFGHIHAKGASGAGIIKLSVSF